MHPKNFSVFSVPLCFELYLIGLSGKARAGFVVPCGY
jgi:hypothetical protein